MKNLSWDKDQQTTVVRALKTIATLRGEKNLSTLDQGLVNGIQHYILNSKLDIDALEIISPDECALHFTDFEHAEQAIQFLIIMPYTDTEASSEKVDLVDAFADAMKIHPETQKMLHQARGRRVIEMEFCIFRKLAPHIIKGDNALDRFHALKPVLQFKQHDFEIAQKYELLGLLPEGTLGRSLWEFYRTRGFAFPGEGHMNINEDFILTHDLSHVLGGCDTTPEGEIAVAAFQGGNMRQHGWLFAVIGVLDFQLGIDAYTGPAHTMKGHLDPELFVEALAMGMRMNIDLSSEWDPWAVMDRPLDEIRKEYNIIGAVNRHRRPFTYEYRNNEPRFVFTEGTH